MADRPLRSRRSRAFVGGALVLLSLLAGTLATEWAWTSALARDPGAPERAQARAVAELRGALGDVLSAMEGRAEDVAERSEIQGALSRDSAGVDAAAIAVVDGYETGPRDAIEVYTLAGERVAWSGFSFPLRRGPIPDSLLTETVRDRAGRRALVAWEPVRVGGRVVGAVRVVRLAQASVPVRNQYLQDYDLSDAWRGDVSRPFAVLFWASPSAPSTTAVPLTGRDGGLLGWAEVPRPSVRALQTQARTAARSVAAFWGVLLLGWLLVGLTTAWWRAVRGAGSEGARRRATALLGAVVGAGVATRYALLNADVPVRWLDVAYQRTALFDPTYLASDLGGGLLRSAGDLALTAAFAVVLASAALVTGLRFAAGERRAGAGRGALGLALVAATAAGATRVVEAVVSQTTLNTAIAFGEHAGVVIDGLILTALGALAAITAAAILALAAALLVVRVPERTRGRAAVVGAALAAAALAAWGGALGEARPDWTFTLVPPLGVVAAAAALATVLQGRAERWAWPLTFRGVLVGGLVVAPIVFGFMQRPLDVRTQDRVASAARVFADQRDGRVSFALDQVLAEARANDALLPGILDAIAAADSLRRTGALAAAPIEDDSLVTDEVGPERQTLDELAESLVSTSLLGSLADVATDLRFISPDGVTLGEYTREGAGPEPKPSDPLSYASMRETYAERAEGGFYRESAPVRGRRGQTRTAGIGPLRESGGDVRAWVYVLTTPRPARLATETPFPRVLAPSELFGTNDEGIAYAEYDEGVLVRSRGGPAPSRLDRRGLAFLERASGVWLNETIEGLAIRAYYVRAADDPRTVVVARVAAGDGPDALFLLLRLCLAALAAGALVFLAGLPIRLRAGLLPAQRTRFRDRVLNRFLVVGLASVALTGVVGQSVIEEQNQQSVRDGLRQDLVQAEALLAADAADAGPRAAAARALSLNVSPDAVAANSGVDVHLYRGADLLASSRRQLVRQRLIEPRLPASVYRALYLDGDPYAFAGDQIGTFEYTTGYKAIADSAGTPIGAIAIPTLPEQATIEAGRARMVAYLFGGLLVLLVAIVGLAVVLAGQLTRPFGRLRRGLQAVGAGEVDEPIPVDTRDEVGQLVETFNAMQADLAESRRQLAEQEREMAWSEMARQVAHEIKNPLMPMKLSVQHLQRVFQPAGEEAPADEKRFSGQFERTTGMLIDQIETLNRIASDFSRFARMPMRSPETVDLVEVAREAAALFEGELAETDHAAFTLDLPDHALPVLADREELRRVVINLLTNALQAIPTGTPGEIRLHAWSDAASAYASVSDNGTGIPEEVQPRVFQPSFSTKTSGMGLGLAISRRGVEAVGGTITFATEIGEGTTFTVRLPHAPAETAAAGDGAVRQLEGDGDGDGHVRQFDGADAGRG